MPTPAPDLRDRFRGALLGAALGDALGAPFEGRAHPPAREVARHEQADDLLRWTDDTAMTIGAASR